jgi:hypothetical protein
VCSCRNFFQQTVVEQGTQGGTEECYFFNAIELLEYRIMDWQIRETIGYRTHRKLWNAHFAQLWC